jgi:hypothetical protein
VITGQDSGEAIEEYAAAYMTKEGAPLRQAASVLLAAVDCIHQHPSTASDTGTLQQTGKHLASRTINAFSGGHQWSMPVMAYALRGFKSFSSTESFWYIFPHDNVSFLEQNGTSATVGKTIPKQDNDESMEATLEALKTNIENSDDQGSSIGAKAYNIGDRTIFVTQAESYSHRGELFKDYSQHDFECIVEIKVKEKEVLQNLQKEPFIK